MRRIFTVAIGAILLFVLGSFSTQTGSGKGHAFPDLIRLPTGFAPEGVVAGYGTDIYAGSLADGSIYRADARTGEGEKIVEAPDGGVAVGLAFDRRSGYLFVAGHMTGQGFVYDTRSGETLRQYEFADPAASSTFVNDVIVTRSAAYFTDSFRQYFYRVPLGAQGQLPPQSEVSEIFLGGDFTLAGPFNANGIEATADGSQLIIVNSSSGNLYRVDPASGVATLIDLGGDTVTAGDGILLDGRTLYVVRNQLNQIAVVELAPDLGSGEVVNVLTDDDFKIPTTVTEVGDALYAVNARFGTPPEGTEYNIVRLSKR